MRGEGVNWGEAGRREKGERRMEKGEGEGSTLHNFPRVLGYHVQATYFMAPGNHLLVIVHAPRLPCAR